MSEYNSKRIGQDKEKSASISVVKGQAGRAIIAGLVGRQRSSCVGHGVFQQAINWAQAAAVSRNCLLLSKLWPIAQEAMVSIRFLGGWHVFCG